MMKYIQIIMDTEKYTFIYLPNIPQQLKFEQ